MAGIAITEMQKAQLKAQISQIIKYNEQLNKSTEIMIKQAEEMSN